MYQLIFLSTSFWFVLPLFAKESTVSELQLPLVYVYKTTAKDITTEEFIAVSYQPVLVTKALNKETIENITPWNFAHLDLSLEAATTFCTVATSNHDTGSKEEEEEESKQQTSDTKRKTDPGSHENILVVSLRRFGQEGQEIWSQAFANITKDMGILIRLPRFLEDFEFDTIKRVGLHYTRVGWSAQIDRSSRSFFSASVVCVMEGRLSLTLTPFDLPWNQMKCKKDVCDVILEESIREDIAKQIFLTRVDLAPRDCLFMPREWQWQASAHVDSIALRIVWEEDLSIREEALEALLSLEEEDDEEEKHLLDDLDYPPEQKPSDRRRERRNSKRNQKKLSKNLWEVLPSSFRRSPVLWSNTNPLLHLVRVYLLSTQKRNLTLFLEEFRVDSGLLPELVDCSSECEASAKNIFHLLDTDADGVLSHQDAMFLTQETFTALTQHLDDLVDELKELGVEQWSRVAEGKSDSNFLQRARDRMEGGAKAAMRRWVAGDMDYQEEQEMKEKIPSLYNNIMAAMKAKEAKAATEREEL